MARAVIHLQVRVSPSVLATVVNALESSLAGFPTVEKDCVLWRGPNSTGIPIGIGPDGAPAVLLVAAEPEITGEEVDATLLECVDDAEASARALFDAGEHDAATACVELSDRLTRRRLERRAKTGGA